MAFDVFRTPPASLSPLQRRFLFVTSLIVALTRLPAISATLCEWDESLFVLALRDYDVTLHHPHPPGFPVYIAMAKLVTLFSVAEFRALQTVVVLAAMSLFPLAFFLGHELRLGFRTAYLGALLFVFFPTIWYHGGTAYSDVPGVALVLAACALLVRGFRDVRAYFVGAIVLGVAAGIRPQSLLIGLAPALVASWIQLRLGWRRFAGAALLGAVVVAASYGGAMLASQSSDRYLAAIRAHGRYIRAVDSIFALHRWPLADRAAVTLLRPMCGGRLPLIVLGLATLGIVGSLVNRHAGVWLLIAMFGPFAVFTWAMLDPHSASRFAVAYMPMYAMLAAFGVAFLASAMPRLAPFAEVALIGAIAVRFAWWTWPALEVARTTSAPPVAALAWATSHPGTIYYEGSLGPFVSALRPSNRSVKLDDARALPVTVNPEDVWVAEGVTDSLDTKVFRRDRTRLAEIVRKRYLAVSATPASSVPILIDGWWTEEYGDLDRWRWMSGRSVTRLAAVGPRARLALRGGCATAWQTVDVALNGNHVATFACSREFETHEWTVDGRTDARNELVLTTSRVLNPARDLGEADARDLGLRMEGIGWKAAP